VEFPGFDTTTESNLSDPSVTILKAFRPRKVRIGEHILTTTPAFDAYWYFATARQDIFHARVSRSNIVSNRLEDEILRDYRFTNAYRASDRVSQYLIREVIGSSDQSWSIENLFFRTMLFKIFNKIDTWEALESEFGDLVVERFDVVAFDRLLSDRQDAEIRNYSAAYIMPSAGGVFGHRRKHSNHLALLQWMMEKRFPEQLSQMETMSDGYALIRSAPSFGPFLAYQFVTDLNYGSLTAFSEMEFVVAGPGAHDGISKCFEGTDRVPAESIIAYMAKHQLDYFADLDHDFRDLWGRPLQLIDCQNLFCEISKYTRVAFPDIKGISGRSRIKQKYRQNSLEVRTPLYPEKWGINPRIDASYEDNSLHRREFQDYRSQECLF